MMKNLIKYLPFILGGAAGYTLATALDIKGTELRSIGDILRANRTVYGEALEQYNSLRYSAILASGLLAFSAGANSRGNLKAALLPFAIGAGVRIFQDFRQDAAIDAAVNARIAAEGR